jgi:hypothetical protein
MHAEVHHRPSARSHNVNICSYCSYHLHFVSTTATYFACCLICCSACMLQCFETCGAHAFEYLQQFLCCFNTCLNVSKQTPMNNSNYKFDINKSNYASETQPCVCVCNKSVIYWWYNDHLLCCSDVHVIHDITTPVHGTAAQERLHCRVHRKRQRVCAPYSTTQHIASLLTYTT